MSSPAKRDTMMIAKNIATAMSCSPGERPAAVSGGGLLAKKNRFMRETIRLARSRLHA